MSVFFINAPTYLGCLENLKSIVFKMEIFDVCVMRLMGSLEIFGKIEKELAFNFDPKGVKT